MTSRLSGAILSDAIAFIDGNQDNAQAADAIGWRGVHHTDAASTRQRLRQLATGAAGLSRTSGPRPDVNV
ncbi:hypothetical protein [Mycetohabitans sp. B46]|uniref:hypothetical protein n=1 Tax=Mycetohabitans sp. B46 TaxID=2772536 RepID=UPI00307EAE5C